MSIYLSLTLLDLIPSSFLMLHSFFSFFSHFHLFRNSFTNLSFSPSSSSCFSSTISAFAILFIFFFLFLLFLLLLFHLPFPHTRRSIFFFLSSILVSFLPFIFLPFLLSLPSSPLYLIASYPPFIFPFFLHSRFSFHSFFLAL